MEQKQNENKIVEKILELEKCMGLLVTAFGHLTENQTKMYDVTDGRITNLVNAVNVLLDRAGVENLTETEPAKPFKNVNGMVT